MASNHDNHNDHSGHHIIPLGVYYKVIGLLLFLTVVTVAAAQVNFGPWNTVIAMLIASIKAFFVLAPILGRNAVGFAEPAAEIDLLATH